MGLSLARITMDCLMKLIPVAHADCARLLVADLQYVEGLRWVTWGQMGHVEL